MTEILTLKNTAIVLDSTSDAPPGFFDREGLFMMPLKVHFGDETYRDGIDMSHSEFYAKLATTNVLPTTSQPTVAEFTALYEELRAGYEHVFSLHLSGEMSGTVRAAEQAAASIDGVSVYDTRVVTSAIALIAERLRTRLERGCTLEEARAFLDHALPNTHLLIHVATLEYLRKGGRIGRAASLIGGVLDVKPLIEATDGTLAGYAKVRGTKKALAAMERFIEERSKPDDELHYMIIDALNEEEPALIRELIERVRPQAQYLGWGKVGAVVGTHIGPGTAAFALIVE
jgi:DegV family protein with EDD domain